MEYFPYLIAAFLLGALAIMVVRYRDLDKKPDPKRAVVQDAEMFSSPNLPFYAYEKKDAVLMTVQPCKADGEILLHDCSHIAVPFILKDGVMVNVEKVTFTMTTAPTHARVQYDELGFVLRFDVNVHDPHALHTTRTYTMLPGSIVVPRILTKS